MFNWFRNLFRNSYEKNIKISPIDHKFVKYRYDLLNCSHKLIMVDDLDYINDVGKIEKVYCTVCENVYVKFDNTLGFWNEGTEEYWNEIKRLQSDQKR